MQKKFILFVCFLLLSFAPVGFAKVIVIGGGASGLMSADTLRKNQVPFVLLEQNPHIGGRVTSRADLLGSGLMLDEGANLVNSTDTVLLGLIKEFQIPIVERFPNGEDNWMYLLDGKLMTQAEIEKYLFRTDLKALKQIALDIEKPRPDYFTNTSLREYFKSLEATDSFVRIMDAFFRSEFGRSIDELNVHVLIEYFAVDLKKKSFLFIPYYDEAYTLPGGTGQILKKLWQRNQAFIRLNHRVTSIQEQRDGTYLVKGVSNGQTFSENADKIIFSAPLLALQSMDVQVSNLSSEVLDEAKNATYGQGMKLHLQFLPGFRDLYPFRGIYLTETGEQIWTSHQGQSGSSGLLTVLRGATPFQFEDILANIEKMAPGARALFKGYEITEAPFTYSGAYRPGESPRLKINDRNTDSWVTVGEASDSEFQGYFEGALRSGKERTLEMLQLSCGQLLGESN